MKIESVADTNNDNVLNTNRRNSNPEDDLSSSDFGTIIDTNKPRRLFRKK